MQVPWSNEEWRRVAVFGLGISGRAAACLLRGRGVGVVAYDDRPLEQLDTTDLDRDPGVELRPGGVGAGELRGLDGVVTSPGLPITHPLIEAAYRLQLPVIAEVELAFFLLEGEVIGITGSNGKSTTTALAGAMLEAAGRKVEVCGNIGAALSSRAEGASGRVFVVELSSFQLETVDRFHPRSAALLNISADHLDRHLDIETYRRIKAAIFERQHAGDLAVLNADDPLVATLEVPSRRRFFSSRGEVADGCYPQGDAVMEALPGAEPTELFQRADLPLPGPHNLENAMAAALLARAHGAEPDDISAGMRAFRGLPHRLELVADRGGVAWYDDSKGTNVAATLRSLEGFADGAVHVILGGRHKGGDLSELRPVLESKARRAYLIGEAAEELARVLAPDVPIEAVGTLERAVARAAADARPGEVVLLSPACASFDQFDNFAERGRAFQRLVSELEGGRLGAQAGL